MKRLWVAVGLFAVLIGSTALARPGQQPGGRAGSPPLFTGTTMAMDGKDLSVARRRFEAGARTYWHSHDRGQLLMVEDGRMRLQKRGSPMKELGKGETDFTPADVVHWHGATPNQPLTQINVGFGGDAKWFEAVTDDAYAGKAKR
jgi:quercetin dioxygenase-like cupin family protein